MQKMLTLTYLTETFSLKGFNIYTWINSLSCWVNNKVYEVLFFLHFSIIIPLIGRAILTLCVLLLPTQANFTQSLLLQCIKSTYCRITGVVNLFSRYFRSSVIFKYRTCEFILLNEF